MREVPLFKSCLLAKDFHDIRCIQVIKVNALQNITPGAAPDFNHEHIFTVNLRPKICAL